MPLKWSHPCFSSVSFSQLYHYAASWFASHSHHTLVLHHHFFQTICWLFLPTLNVSYLRGKNAHVGRMRFTLAIKVSLGRSANQGHYHFASSSFSYLRRKRAGRRELWQRNAIQTSLSCFWSGMVSAYDSHTPRLHIPRHWYSSKNKSWFILRANLVYTNLDSIHKSLPQMTQTCLLRIHTDSKLIFWLQYCLFQLELTERLPNLTRFKSWVTSHKQYSTNH